MHPRLGPIPAYGVLYLTGIIAHFLISWRIAKRAGLKRRVWIVVSLCYLLGMTLGAKVLFNLRTPGLGLSDLMDAQRWRQGGMWGGLPAYFALAVPAVVLLTKNRRAALDLVALAIPIPWIISKVGCFLNGCCHGRPTSLPWAVTFPQGARGAPPGIAVHPTQIYEIIIMVVILIVFARLKADRWRGTRLLWFLALYGLARAATDFLRGETSGPLIGPLTLTQVICLATAGIAALALLFVRPAPERSQPQPDITVLGQE